MKKFICFLGAFAGLLAACSTTTSQQQVTEAPVMSAYYSDWDRAVRADVDMQNMYIGTPSKITRPIDMYMAMALALKYSYTGRRASYQVNLVKGSISPATLPALPSFIRKVLLRLKLPHKSKAEKLSTISCRKRVPFIGKL